MIDNKTSLEVESCLKKPASVNALKLCTKSLKDTMVFSAAGNLWYISVWFRGNNQQAGIYVSTIFVLEGQDVRAPTFPKGCSPCSNFTSMANFIFRGDGFVPNRSQIGFRNIRVFPFTPRSTATLEKTHPFRVFPFLSCYAFLLCSFFFFRETKRKTEIHKTGAP